LLLLLAFIHQDATLFINYLLRGDNEGISNLYSNNTFIPNIRKEHRIVSEEEWVMARKELLKKEKEFTAL
jgi:hypothetical protein